MSPFAVHVGLSWPTDYSADETGYQVVRYTDGRPSAGVLSTNSMWWRYMSNGTNYNRGRANAISKLFLCTDYLEKSIEFDRDVNLLDEGAVNEALQTNPVATRVTPAWTRSRASSSGFTTTTTTG